MEDTNNIAKVEQEIAESLAKKVKGLSDKEAKSLIKEAIVKRKYLTEDWQTDYAVQRVQEKIGEFIKANTKFDVDSKQVLIKNFNNEVEARLGQKILEENGIKSVLQFGISLYGNPVYGPLGVPMFVLEKDLNKAKKLLDQI